MDSKFIEKAEQIVKDNQEAIARAGFGIYNIGSEFCTNCSSVVGG